MIEKKKKKIINKIDVDNLLMNLKPKGRFQLTQFFLLVTCYPACAASILKLVFIAYVPEVTCTELNNKQLAIFGYETNTSEGVEYESCHVNIYNRKTSLNETIPCINGFTYSIARDKSFVSEWDLVCEHGALSELTQTIYAVGCFLGALIIPIFSDKFGRKPTHFICFMLLMINEMVLAAVGNFWLFFFLRMTEGVLSYGMFMPAYSAMLELFPGSVRTVFAASTGILWGVGMLLVTPLAYVCRNQTWRIVCVAFGAVACTSLLNVWFVEESIRWLLTNNKIDATRKIVKRAARENGVNFDEVWEKCVESSQSLMCKGDKDISDNEVEGSVEDLGIMTLVKDPLARIMSLILFFNALMNSLTYYGIYMTASQMSGNYYINFCLTSIMGILGTVIMLFILKVCERRTTMFCFQLFSGCSLIISVIINFAVEPNAATAVANKVFTLFGMFGISGSFSVLWLYAPEVYPTNLRNSGLGLMGMGTALGNILSPFSRYAGRHLAWLPSTIFGVGIVLGSIMLLNLPESKNAQMPTTMDDVRALRKKRTFQTSFFSAKS